MFLLVLSLSMLSCSAPPPVPAPALLPVDDCPITLNAQARASHFPTADFTGTCPLPDGAILLFDFTRVDDMILQDRLVAWHSTVGGATVVLDGQKFSFGFPFTRSGRYTASVSVPLGLQEKEQLNELKGKGLENRRWHFSFDLAFEGWLLKSGKSLGEVAPLVKSAGEYVDAYEAAIMSEERWGRDQGGLIKSGSELQKDIESARLLEFYPAAIGELRIMVRYLLGNLPYCRFEEGRFVGVRRSQSKYGEPLSNSWARGDRYVGSFWEGFRRCLREHPSIAAREFCLSVLASRRASNGQVTPEAESALEAAREFRGMGPWVGRLRSAAPAEFDALEAELRKLQDPSRK